MSKLDEALFKAYRQSPARPAASQSSEPTPAAEATVRREERSARASRAAATSPPGLPLESPGRPIAPPSHRRGSAAVVQPPTVAAAEGPMILSMPAAEATSRAEHRAPAFRPMLQVDAFAWPEALAKTTPRMEEQFDAAAAAIVEPNGHRQAVVALTGSTVEAGCSTLLLGAARRLAARGMKVALVDADETRPALGSLLGLLPTLGWEEIAAGRQPLTEALIESIGDRLSLLPLCNPGAVLEHARDSGAAQRMASALATLREHYHLVLVDLGSPTRWTSGALDDAIDMAVMIHNVARATADDVRSARDQLAARRVACAGLIENFAPREAAGVRRRAA